VIVSVDRFQSGMTFREFVSQSDLNRERLERVYGQVQLDAATVEAFRKLPRTLKVLALSEDWAADAVVSLPLIARLAEACGKLDLRAFLRDKNLDIMDRYLKEGKFQSIPVFAFFDESLENEVGHYVERPTSLNAMHKEVVDRFVELNPELADEMAKLPADRPEAVKRVYRGWVSEQFAQRQAEIAVEVQKELRRVAGV
jgi:hypothetical protein